jgi:hypothetical protein
VTAPITAERLAEIEARANAIHAEMSHTRTRCRHCDTVNPPLDEWGCHDECPDAEEWPTEVERDGTKLESADGLREIAGHMTDLVAEVRRLAAAMEIARREGAEAMRAALIARFKGRVEYLRPWAAEDTEDGCHTGAWTEALNAVQFTQEMAFPLDAPGGER